MCGVGVNKPFLIRIQERRYTDVVPQSREPTNSPCLRLVIAEVEWSQRKGGEDGRLREGDNPRAYLLAVEGQGVGLLASPP